MAFAQEMCEWRFNLWVDDSALHSFEVCIETIDDGVAAFFLEAIHVQARYFDSSVCKSVVMLSISHVDASEMTVSSVVPGWTVCHITVGWNSRDTQLNRAPLRFSETSQQIAKVVNGTEPFTNAPLEQVHADQNLDVGLVLPRP